MCSRFASYRPTDDARRIFQDSEPTSDRRAQLERSTDPTGARREEPAGDRMAPPGSADWRLVSHFTKELKVANRPINARAETAGRYSVFRPALISRRCLIPVEASYEWRATSKGKQPYAIARTDGAPLAFAGLWEGWRAPDGTALRTFAILTTPANETMGQLHDRMPVVLDQTDWPLWPGLSGDFDN